jgi:hypothetical protein
MGQPNQSGIRIEVYRWSLGDCTNGGISSNHNALTLLLPGGGPFEPSDDAPAVKMVTKQFGYDYKGSDRYCSLVPWDIEKDCALGTADSQTGTGRYMCGGNVGYSSDSRFPALYPLMIHDRTEA